MRPSEVPLGAGRKALFGLRVCSRISTLQVIFGLKKQENVLIRVLICGPKRPDWVAGFVPALVPLQC